MQLNLKLSLLVAILILVGSFSLAKAKTNNLLYFNLKLPVIIHDEDDKQTVLSNCTSLKCVFNQQKITVYPEDKVTVFPDPSFGLGCNVTIQRATPIELKYGSKDSKIIRTWAKTVAEFVAEQKISINKKDILKPGLKTNLRPYLAIEIIKIGQRKEVDESSVAFEVIQKPDSDLEQGKSRVGQTGENGVMEKTYLVTYRNGELLKKKLLSEEIAKQPQDQIVYYGTKPPIISTRYGLIKYREDYITASNYYSPGTKLVITNLDNGWKVVVIVNSGCGHCGPVDAIMDIRKSAFNELVPGKPEDTGVLRNVKVEEVAN